MTQRVGVVSASIGAGHDGAADELCRRLEDQGLSTFRYDFLESAPHAGRLIRHVYEWWLRRAPWAYDATYRAWADFPPLVAPTVAVLALVFGRPLRRQLAADKVDLVVSTYPLASVALGRMRRKRSLDVPVATFVTDFSLHPMWVDAGVDLHLCVHPDTARAARAATGGPALATGPMVGPAFARPSAERRHQARRDLGVPDDAVAVLVVAGSWGVGAVEETYRELCQLPGYFPIVACGRNDTLRAALATRPGGRALGWTDDMATVMAASDLVVQNAGGLTSMEAFASGVPVLTYRPIPGHGQDNAELMHTAGVARFVRSAEELTEALAVAAVRPSLQVARAEALFRSDPADAVVALASGATPPVRLRRRDASRRVALGTVSLASAWLGLNLVAEAATAHAFASVRPAQTEIYLGARLSTADLGSPRLARLLVADHVTAVLEGNQVVGNDAAVAALAAHGVGIADGGWGSRSDLALLGVSEVARSADAFEAALGRPVPLLVPEQPLTVVDLAITKLKHLHVVGDVTTLGPGTSAAVLLPGRVYVFDAERLSPTETAAALQRLELTLQSDGEATQSLAALLR